MNTEYTQEGAVGGVRRWPREMSAVLFGLEALLLLGSLPVVGLMMLGSGWEGGDEARKSRLLDWGLTSVPVVLAAIGLSFAASFAVAGARRSATLLALLAAGSVVVLALGWAWVWQGVLLSDTTVLGCWLGWTLPPVAGASLACALLPAPDTPEPAA